MRQRPEPGRLPPAPRILHAPADVGGNAYGLSRAERELGLHSDVAVLVAGPYGYGADIRMELDGRRGWRTLGPRIRLLVRAMRSYDLIHFNFGQSFLPIWAYGHVLSELPLLKRTGKTILVTFQGCDVRPQACCFCTKEVCRAGDRYRMPNAALFLRYADRCFHLNPDLGRWLPESRFVPYANVDPRALAPAVRPVPAGRDELVVAHAPTDREVKGTEHVLTAIERLREEGVAVRLDLIEGAPRDQVLTRLRTADVVVDQLLLGWYGGFAVEAMALAKPVLCHIREETPADNPFGEELPIVRATPDTLAVRLRELAVDDQRRAQLGAASRRFVELHHDPRQVVREMLAGLLDEEALAGC
jgi:glycosyltransferase involved in cell wall biosynthesis